MLDQIAHRHRMIARIVSGKPIDRPLVAVSPGSGLITRSAVASGVDLFFTFSAGVYRNAGIGSLASFLPYGNANELCETLLRTQIMPNRGSVPVVAGVMSVDPLCPIHQRLERLREIGVSGITNWPATGLVDGTMREVLSANGLTHEQECEMLTLARRLGFATFGFALSPDEVGDFCAVGVDGLILNVGLTRRAPEGLEKRNRLHAAIARAQPMWEVAKQANPIPLSFLFGGSIVQPLDVEEFLREVPLHGYAGGSAFERLPVVTVVESMVRRMKGIPRKPTGVSRSEENHAALSIIGQSRAITMVRELISRVAPHDVSVLITGETGTGKELVARSIHRESARRDLPFITLNCGAIPDSLVESEFFGYEKGAFTGADQRRLGKFELANHGTLFLDEVGDLNAHGQVALLRVLQQGEVFRLGGQRSFQVDVRIVAATNRDLIRAVTEGNFRADLFHRLCVFEIAIPPLRERSEDIPLLVAYTLSRLSTRVNRSVIGVTDRFMEALRRRRWNGNVRELEHVLTRATIMEDTAVLEGEALGHEAEGGIRADRRGERARETLSACYGNKAEAARRLGVSRKTLYEWLSR